MNCAIGCTQRGRHVVECPDNECRGCLPALAEIGKVCTPCHARFRRDLVIAPDLVAHLRHLITPSMQQIHDSDVRVSGEPPAPLSVGPVAAADRVHAMLANLAIAVVEGRRVTAPSWVGSDIRMGSIHSAARCVGLKPGNWERATAGVVDFLLRHTEWIVGQEDAAEWLTMVHQRIRLTSLRFPIEDRPVYLPVPCPACGAASLVRYTPRWRPPEPEVRQECADGVPDAQNRTWGVLGASIGPTQGPPVQIQCQRQECGHIVPEDRMAWLTKLAASGAWK